MESIDLIDRIHRDGSRTAILCEKTIPGSSSIFREHFPEHPVVPGVLLIEAMAQAGGYLVMREEELRRMALMVGVRSARFLRFVSPDDCMQISARIHALRESSAVVAGQVRVAGRVCARAEIVYHLGEFPSAATREQIHRTLTERTC